MNKFIGTLVITLLTTLFFPQMSLADDLKIAYVDVTEVYNKSVYVQNANKSLQVAVKDMEDKLQVERKRLQTLVTTYENTSNTKKKRELADKISAGQANLAKMTQEFQKKIQEQQNAGMQKFTALAKAAVEKVAKELSINVVLNNTSIAYTDNSWTDVTKNVVAAMEEK